MFPIRAQRLRSKGFKMVHVNGLPNYYAGRPSKFGNPFRLIDGNIYVDASHRRSARQHKRLIVNGKSIDLDTWTFLCSGDDNKVQDMYKAVITDTWFEYEFFLETTDLFDIKYWLNHFEDIDFSELKGKNLYCFCSEDFKYCHCDVLLELANK